MLEHFVDSKLLDQTEPLTVYRVAVANAFMSGEQGPVVDSLRRTFMAFNRGTPQRLTSQWDALIQLDALQPIGSQ